MDFTFLDSDVPSTSNRTIYQVISFTVMSDGTLRLRRDVWTYSEVYIYLHFTSKKRQCHGLCVTSSAIL